MQQLLIFPQDSNHNFQISLVILTRVVYLTNRRFVSAYTQLVKSLFIAKYIDNWKSIIDLIDNADCWP